MRLVVDGVIYEFQDRGGISRLYSEILPRICEIEPACRIKLFTCGDAMQPLPTHEQIAHTRIPRLERLLRPRRLWRHLVPEPTELAKRLWLASSRDAIWHSTYFTRPDHWKGPVVVTVHDMIYERFPDLFDEADGAEVREQKRRCVSTADLVICNSETTRRDVEDYYGIPAGKTRVTPLAYSETFGLAQGHLDFSDVPVGPFLLYVGERGHYKNFRRLLEAYSRWPRREEVSLVVAGRQWSEDEQRCLSASGIDHLVRLRTQVGDRSLGQLYSTAIGFVYPSLFEGFGIPLLEAMACACPIVASRIPSTIEVAGEVPIYFEPQELDDLVAALDAVVGEGRESKRTRAGIEWAKRYSWDKTARQTLEVYYALLG